MPYIFFKIYHRLFGRRLWRKNMFRFLWYSLIVCGVSILLSWVICVVYEPMSVLYWYLAGVVGGAVSGCFISGILSVRASENDNDDYENVKTTRVILPLLLVFTVAVAAIVCFIHYRNILAELLLIKNLHTDFGVITTVLGVYTVFPAAYFFVKIGCYGRYMCTKCGHIFCIEEILTYSGESNYSQYKTDTNRECVGSISAGGNKVADVYADVDTSYYRNVKKSTKSYKGTCKLCGAVFHRTEVETTKGEWK